MANKKNVPQGTTDNTAEEVASSTPGNDIAQLTQSVGTLLQVIQAEKAERSEQMAEMLENVGALATRIDMIQNEVEAVADKGRLDQFEKQTTGKEPKKKVVNLQTYNGKVIVGWSDMLTNSVEKDPDSKKIKEDQTTTLTFSDGTEEKVTYTTWQARRMPLKCILEGKIEELEPERTICRLVDEKGIKYEVDAKFVN